MSTREYHHLCTSGSLTLSRDMDGVYRLRDKRSGARTELSRTQAADVYWQLIGEPTPCDF